MLPVDAPRGVEVELIVRVDGVGHGQVERDAELQCGIPSAQLLRGEAVTQQQVVRRIERGLRVLDSGRVLTAEVAEEGRAPGLVERRPGLHAVAEHVVH